MRSIPVREERFVIAELQMSVSYFAEYTAEIRGYFQVPAIFQVLDHQGIYAAMHPSAIDIIT